MKNNIELIHQSRNAWTINPRTRVHDNNIKRNKKKLRQEGKKICKGKSLNNSRDFSVKTVNKIRLIKNFICFP